MYHSKQNQENTMNLEKFLNNHRKRVNQTLDQCLPPENKEPKQLHEAMRYAVLNGGKRLRPLLVYAVGKAFNLSPDILDIPAASVELIHAFSLVHDDLPAMDDDDLRRGKPTCHKVFGEAIAILAGNALPWLAIEILHKQKTLKSNTILDMISILTQACGSLGLIGGQALDMQLTEKTDITQLENIYSLKTGALFRACIQLGSIAANIQDIEQLKILNEFANNIGLAFQIQDDLLAFKIHHKVDKKITYPTLVGIDQAKTQAQDLYKKAMKDLENMKTDTEILVSLVDYIMQREY